MKTVTVNIADIIAELDAELAQASIKAFDKQIDETVNSLVREAVTHFSKRFRKGDKDDFDERYFYSENEVRKFFELNKNPNVKMRIEYSKIFPNKIDYYILYRE